MSTTKPSIYISHAWGGKSEVVVQEIVKRFHQEGLEITLDKNDLGYRQSISEFMVLLGKADAIILVISNKYLHSEYCMFELLEIYENKNILHRIFPVVLEEVAIAKSTDRIELVKYWENQTNELEDKIRELKSLSYIEGITDDLNLYQNIRSKIAKLTAILKDINTLHIDTHQNSNYDNLFFAVKKYLDSKKEEQKTPVIHSEISDIPPPAVANHPAAADNSKKNRTHKFLFPGIGILLLAFGIIFLFRIFFPEVKADEQNYSATEPLSEKVENPNEAKKSSTNTAFENNELPVKTGSETNVVLTPEKSSLSSQQKNSPAGVETNQVKSLSSENKTETESIVKKAEEPEIRKAKTVMLTIPTQYIEAEFGDMVSSNTAAKGEYLFLECLTRVAVDQHVVISKGNHIRAKVTEAIPSYNQSIGQLTLDIEAVQINNGDWIEVQLPKYGKKAREEIVFQKGQRIPKIKLASTTINF